MDILNEILRLSLLKFLWGGSVLGVLIGAGLMIQPNWVMHLSRSCSRWISADKVGEVLDRPRWVERVFYRHHQIAGATVFIGALVVLYIFLAHDGLVSVSRLFPRNYSWLFDAAMRILLIGCGLAAFVGAIVVIRPSHLREFEKSANRWVSTDGAVKVFNGMHFGVEHSLFRHHRIAGISITLGSLYVAVVLGYFLFWRPGVL